MKKCLLLIICFMFFASFSTISFADNDEITFRFSLQQPRDLLAGLSAFRIKERIEEESNNRIKIDVYPDNQLGDATQVYEEIIRGTIDIAHISVPDQFDSRLGIGFLPYIGRDYNEIRKVLGADSFLFQEMSKIQEELNVKFFAYYAEGFNGVASVKKPKNISDFSDKGILIRVPNLTPFKYAVESLGFRTTSMPYIDVYSSLQTGVVDGWIGGTSMINYIVFRDVIKYFTQYNTTFEATQYIMSMKAWNKLSSDDQEMFTRIFTEEASKSFVEAESYDQLGMIKLRESGIETIEFSSEVLKIMADHVREESWPKLEKLYSQELLDGLKSSYEK